MALLDLGVQVRLLAGRDLPVPVAGDVIRALRHVEITHGGDGTTYFQLGFVVSRSVGLLSMDYDLVEGGPLQFGYRVILTVTQNATPKVLVDGFVVNQQISAANAPGTALLTVTGEDLGLAMDANGGETEQFPNQSVKGIVDTILLRYASLGLTADTTAPPGDSPLADTDGVRTRTSSDRAYLRALAERYNYVFQIRPRVEGKSTAYWGPRPDRGTSQPALSANMGPFTNVASLSSHADALAAIQVTGQREDPARGSPVDVGATSYAGTALSKDEGGFGSTRLVRTKLLRAVGLAPADAGVLSQAEVDRALQGAVELRGELDTSRYGRPLEPWSPVDVRGLGSTYDGKYYISELTHLIERGSYRQRFRLAREGTGASSLRVQP